MGTTGDDAHARRLDVGLPAYLRGLRARTRPEALGLPRGQGRRLPGLRREEVAVLAGMSADYYTRLEQGREQNPSAQVLTALARGLDLDVDETRHLFVLAGVTPPPSTAPGVHTVPPHLRRLLEAWPDTPAFVITPAHDVVHANALGAAVYAPFAVRDNLVRMMFADPLARTFNTDWPSAALAAVASLRAAAAEHPDDVRTAEVVAELTGTSEEFTALWAQQRVRPKTHARKTFAHPDVGPLTLDAHTFDVREAPGLALLVYDAPAGSTTWTALRLLASLTATRGA